jgi:hypothetical protein
MHRYASPPVPTDCCGPQAATGVLWGRLIKPPRTATPIPTDPGLA